MIDDAIYAVQGKIITVSTLPQYKFFRKVDSQTVNE